MSSIIKCIPLSGTEVEGAPCCLLQVDEFKFLMDCGLDHSLDFTYLQNIKKLSGQLDAVFLSHQDPLHLGGLPYLVKEGLSCPVYATELVKCMGQLSCYDLVQSEKESGEERDLYGLDEVDMAFERVKEVRYNQVLVLQGKIGTQLQVTAMQSGHMVGGAVWRVVKEGMEAVVYASHINHRKESHLNSTALPSIKRPHLLIINAPNTLQQPSLKSRNDALLKTVQRTVRRGGNMLLCCDTAGRILEVIYILEQLWRRQDTGLMAYNLVLFNPVAFNVVKFASLHLEWLNEKVMKAFEATRANPFATRFLQICHSSQELLSIHGPKVVLATYSSLETGYARDLFSQWASIPKNTVFFATKPPVGSLGRRVLEGGLREVEVKVGRKVDLDGAELAAWEEKQRQSEERWKEERISDEEEEEEDEDEVQEKVHDVYEAGAMYPHKETPLKWDHYGVTVDLTSLFDSAPRKRAPTLLHHASTHLEVPCKVVVSREVVEVRCEVVSEDFEGASDVVSIVRILKLLCPRHLLFMGHQGNRISKLLDASYLPENTSVHLASPLQPTDVSSDSHMLQLRLKDSLISQLQFRRLEGSDVQVSFFSSLITSDAHPSDVCVGGDDDDDEVLSLTHLPSSAPVPVHAQVFINRPILSEVKVRMLQAGIRAEMVAGMLVCEDQVIVKKGESGRYELEGQTGKLYYQVRQALYDCFVVV